MFLATGNAQEAVVDAVVPLLKADAALVALLGGQKVYGHVPQSVRTTHPYVRVSNPALRQDDYGAMGVGGGRVTFDLDTWGGNSATGKGPHAVRAVLARVLTVLERGTLTLIGFQCAGGSLHCQDSVVFDEPDPDKPEELLYHGHQTWEALVDE